MLDIKEINEEKYFSFLDNYKEYEINNFYEGWANNAGALEKITLKRFTKNMLKMIFYFSCN